MNVETKALFSKQAKHILLKNDLLCTHIVDRIDRPSGDLLFTRLLGHFWACSSLNCASFFFPPAAYPSFHGLPLQFVHILSQESLHIPAKVDFNRDGKPHDGRLKRI